MISNCQGPCLFHCYYKHSILLLLIGILIGYLLSKGKQNTFFNSNEKK